MKRIISLLCLFTIFGCDNPNASNPKFKKGDAWYIDGFVVMDGMKNDRAWYVKDTAHDICFFARDGSYTSVPCDKLEKPSGLAKQ